MSGPITGRTLRALGSFFPARCTIETATATRDAWGQPIAAWAALSGHTGLACRVAPAGVSPTEGRRMGLTVETASHVMLIAGSYPDIQPPMRAVVTRGATSTTYDIVGVEQDGDGSLTRVQLRRTVASG